MKLRVFNALLFIGLATWMAFRHAWAVPGFVLLAAAQLAIPFAVWRRWDGRAAFAALEFSLGLTYIGLAYLVSAFAGRPTTLGFWAAFGAAVVILGPVLWVFHRITLGKEAHQ